MKLLHACSLAVLTGCGGATSALQDTRTDSEAAIVPANFDLRTRPLTAANEKHWADVLWRAAIVHPDRPYVAETVSAILRKALVPRLAPHEENLVSAALRLENQLFTQGAVAFRGHESLLRDLALTAPRPLHALQALTALVDGRFDSGLRSLVRTVGQRFSADEPLVAATLQDLETLLAPTPSPPLSDLLAVRIAQGYAHLFVLCRADRGVACRAVLRDASGSFVRTGNGRLWSVELLADSIHQLRPHFSYGFTPQGIYRMFGTRAPSVYTAYGRYPRVVLGLPFEDIGTPFLPGGSAVYAPARHEYGRLLPHSWRASSLLYQAYWAGRLGRGAIRIHGTGEPVETFGVKLFSQPPASRHLNPALGCISAYERAGSPEGEMPDILARLEEASQRGSIDGYVVVAEVERLRQGPVSVEEVEEALRTSGG